MTDHPDAPTVRLFRGLVLGAPALIGLYAFLAAHLRGERFLPFAPWVNVAIMVVSLWTLFYYAALLAITRRRHRRMAYQRRQEMAATDLAPGKPAGFVPGLFEIAALSVAYLLGALLLIGCRYLGAPFPDHVADPGRVLPLLAVVLVAYGLFEAAALLAWRQRAAHLRT